LHLVLLPQTSERKRTRMLHSTMWKAAVTAGIEC